MWAEETGVEADLETDLETSLGNADGRPEAAVDRYGERLRNASTPALRPVPHWLCAPPLGSAA